MPRKPKEEENGAVHAAKPGHNGYDGAKLETYVKRYMNLQKECADIMDAAKAECQPLRDDQKEVRKEAAEAGFEKGAFDAVLARYRLEDRIKRIPNKLDEDERENYEQMLHALGKTAETLGPLGEAALEHAQANAPN